MASKLLRHSHLRLRALYSSNPSGATRGLLSLRLFSNASSEKPTGFERASTSTSSSLKDLELAKFASIAETWWDSEGPFKPLHVMNPTRLAFIRSTLCRHFSKDPNSARPFEGLKIVDVGCGGGILSEPLARMGATVTGVDAVEKNIKIARLHAGDMALESTKSLTDVLALSHICSEQG
uniref:Methyltransferase domain-containing protein n=1 Tax=Fagus sylvatica TaxID=28930 RepID=A0A2N9I703_FAGSY